MVYRWLPKPRALRAAQFRPDRIKRLLVLSKLPSPTFAYYFEERLTKLTIPAVAVDLNAPLPRLSPDGLFVVLCRYVPPRQLFWLLRHRKRLAGIALFIDDDLAATVAEPNGPVSYRVYLWAMGILPLAVLNGLLTHVWASTPDLADALGHAQADVGLLGPCPPASTWRAQTDGIQRASSSRLLIGFHATGAHFSEHRFLVPIVRTILERYPHLDFEVVATGRTASYWRKSGIAADRIAIVSPRPWAAYLSDTARRSPDIFLVPLLPNRANDARADTKRIDACRMGAAAIFSRCHVYERHAAAGEMLVGNTSESWTDAIVGLVDDAATRAAVRSASRDAVKKMRSISSWDLPGLEPKRLTGLRT